MRLWPGGLLPGRAHPSTFHLCSAVLRYTWEAPVVTHAALCELRTLLCPRPEHSAGDSLKLRLFSAKVVGCLARQASSVPAILRDPEHSCQQAGTSMGSLLLLFPTELPAGDVPLTFFSAQAFRKAPACQLCHPCGNACLGSYGTKVFKVRNGP